MLDSTPVTASDADAVTEEQDVNYVRVHRKQIVENLLGTGIPDDKGLLIAAIAVLDGIDRSAVNRMKINSDKEINKNNAGAAGLIAQMLKTINTPTALPVSRERPDLPNNLPPIELIEGELDTGTIPINTASIATGL